MIDIKELRKVTADCYWPTSPVTIDGLIDRLEAAEKERDALQAKIEQIERQEPVAKVESWTNGSYTRHYKLKWLRDVDEGAALYALPGAQPAPSIKDAIIDDLQSQFDSEGITEHDSVDALIRLSDAIAAVEDNFVQPAPSGPEGWKEGVEAVAAMLQKKADDYAEEYGYGDMGVLSFGEGMCGQIKMDYYSNLVELTEEVRAMLTATTEAKP